jgi:hypothetical protein
MISINKQKVGLCVDENLQKQVEETYNLIVEANNQMLEIWSEQVIFTWQWWLGIGFTLIPWILWVKYRKKDSTIRLLSAGFFVLIISSWLDFLGVALGLWYYVYEVVYFIPNYFPWDFSLFPVIYMAVIQTMPRVSPLIKAVILSALLAFIGEPLVEWLGFYQPVKWEHIYSFPIYALIYLIAHYISKRESWAKVESNY